MILRSLLAVSALIALISGPACAAGTPPATGAASGLTGSDGAPLDVTADNAVEWHQTERAYVARGHAHAVKGTNSVDADVLTAYYRDGPGGNSQIVQIVAEGNVHIMTPGRDAFGGKAVYDADRQLLMITGGPLRLNAGTDVVTARDSIEFYEKENIGVARGDAIAIRGTDRMRADVLIGQFTKAPDGSNQMTRIDGSGKVVVTTATDVATSDKLVYSVPDDTAVLMGNVRITRGDNQIGGESAEMNMKTKVNRVIAGPQTGNRVHVLIIPGSGNATLPGSPKPKK